MKLTRRLLALAAMLALPLAMVGEAAGAPSCKKNPNHPSCGGGTQDPVEVSIEGSIIWAHEAGDMIYYTVTVINNSGNEVEVDVIDETGTRSNIGTVGAGDVQFDLSYLVTADDIATPLDLTRTVTASYAGETIAQATATVEVRPTELCPIDGDGKFVTGSETCIWKPSSGNWKISVVPASTRPANIMITVRDHSPGNWCPQGVTEKSRGGDPVETTISIPPIPADWAGGNVCDIGGAAGDFYGVGTPSSFYLDTKGTVTITPFP